MSPRHTIVVGVTLHLQWIVQVGASPLVFAQPTDRVALLARVDSLRASGEYERALSTARDLRTAVEHDPECRLYAVDDAGRLVATLECAVQLPADAQAELAEADRLYQEIEDAREAGEYALAEQKALRQVEVRTRLLGAEHTEVAHSLNGLAIVVDLSGDHARAEALYDQSLAMRRRLLGDAHPAVAQSLNNIANLLWASGDYARAEPVARQAIATYQAALGEEHEHVASALGTLGTVLQLRGKYEEAEQTYRRGLAMRRKLLGDSHPDIAKGLNNLGILLKARGDYTAAEPLYRRALALRRELFGDDHPAVAQSLHNLAVLLDVRGDNAGAEPLYREALAMRRKVLGEHPEVARSLDGLAGILRAKSDGAGAELLNREAFAMFTKFLGPEHPAVGANLGNLASLLRDRGDFAGADSLYREVLAIFRKSQGEQHPEVAETLCNIGVTLRYRGDLRGAERVTREALAMQRLLLGEEHPDVGSSLYELALVLELQGETAGAEPLLSQSCRVFEAARRRAGFGQERATFAESPYPALAAVRLSLAREADAWPSAERAMGRVLADLVVVADRERLDPETELWEDSLRIALGDAERRLATFREQGATDSSSEVRARVEQARNTLLELEARWSSFQEEQGRLHPVESGEPLHLDRVQTALSTRTAIVGWLDVEWTKGQADSWGYVIRNRGPVHWERLEDEEESEGGKSLREALTDPLGQSGKEVRREVYRARVAALESHLAGVEELVVLPSGPMLGVPIEALEDERGVALGERCAISYAPSATIYTWLREKERPSRELRPGLFLGDAVFSRQGHVVVAEADPGLGPKLIVALMPVWRQLLRSAVAGNEAALDSLPQLPATRPEVEKSSSLFRRSTVLLGREATEQALVGLAEGGDLASYRVLHFATHGLTDDERPEQSALVLSRRDLPDALEAALEGRRVFDGLLTAKEIVREWKLDADLVVLSGCETGLGREVAGEGYIGLATAFLQAGARSVLVSLWPVEDRSTSLLMRRFYENWTGVSVDGSEPRGPMSKVRALQEAKTWMRQQYPAPFYWAGFILIGDPS